MSEILFLIFGLAAIIIGFGMYSYFHKNEESIDAKPGKLHGTAVMVIVTGIIISIFSVLALFL